MDFILILVIMVGFGALLFLSSRTERTLREEIGRNREEVGVSAKQGREEMSAHLNAFNQSLIQLTSLNEQKLEALRGTIEEKLSSIQKDSSAKLEQMRQTVDEKLHETLERRLGESFKLVSDRLELVQRGLGEMQSLAAGVGDLKKVLTNVKMRGIWGEVQLENLLDQLLTKEQYEKNVVTKKGSRDPVDFAIRLPGRDTVNGNVVWLPIDAKFPMEDYQRLVDAYDQADPRVAEEVGRQFEAGIKTQAKSIREKYLDPPNTTDFGIMFLPIEGLYAEVWRRPGLGEVLQREYQIVVTGPNNLYAFLNSLQMGFRTLAIEKRSSEVWTLLSGVKTEFGKFGDILEKTHKKLQEASNTIEEATKKTRKIEKKLKDVQEMPPPQSQDTLAEGEAEEIHRHNS